MSLEDLEEALEEIFPNGFEIDFDDDGQIVIYTGLMQDDDGEIVEFDPDEDEDPDYDDYESLDEEDDEDEEDE